MSHRDGIHDLYVGSYRRLVLQLYPVTGDIGEAQEVVQEAFVKLLASPSQSTTDGGRTWRLVLAVPRFEEIVFAWVDRDGGLSVTDRARNRYVSTDGGQSFARTELPVSHAFAITGGLEGWPIDPEAADPVDLYLSEDGRTWRPVQVPYYQR